MTRNNQTKGELINKDGKLLLLTTVNYRSIATNRK